MPDSAAARRPGPRAELVLGGVAAGVLAVVVTDAVVRAASGTGDLGWSVLA